MKKISLLLITFVLVSSCSALGADKVVVIPLSSSKVAGTDGQLQYNDNGKLAGAEFFYLDGYKWLQTLGGEIRLWDEPGMYGVSLEYAEGGDFQITHLGMIDITKMIISENIVGFTDTGKVGVATLTPMATLDINGYTKLKAYNSAPIPCTVEARGTLSLNNLYDLCICKPFGLASLWLKVEDTNQNCW